MRADEIEVHLAEYFHYRTKLIVPNVSYGWGLHYEADLIILYKSGWWDEIEIKVSTSDIKADLKKRKWNHYKFNTGYLQNFPRKIYFAVPYDLKDNPNIPERAGVISVHPSGFCCKERPPKVNKRAKKATPDQRLKLAELGSMRIWSLKEHRARMIKSREPGND